MEYTTLGKTGLRVSRMGFGGIPIQKVDASVTRKLMERLAERGVNYIDTARGYTVSESGRRPARKICAGDQVHVPHKGSDGAGY